MHRELLPFRLMRASGVISRSELLDALESVREESGQSGNGFGLILFSIDRFRFVNGRIGHAHADTVLQRVGMAARHVVRRKGIVGRWGADEFLCVLPEADMASTYECATQIRQRINNLVIPVGSAITTVTCSFGMACYPDTGTDTTSLLMAADEAMYAAKQAGRDRIVSARGGHTPIFTLGKVLETALREERIMPAYQPIFDLTTGQIAGEEALARIITTDERVLPAQEFIDAATQLGLTHKIDQVIVASALKRCAENRARGQKLTVFANVSGSLLRQPEMIRELFRTVAHECAPGDGNERPTRLVLEITERELVDDPGSAKSLLEPFIQLGLGLALDDFGSGYSSYHYLADLPISFLKIDGRLVQRLHESRVRAIIRGIRNTATELGLITLAEYVEQERQANILRELGVNWAQGHYFSKAVVDEREASIRRHLSVNWTEGYYYRRR